MAIATERETWVGRAVPRIEDETLLRGEGSFMDDIDPVRNAAHAAILRSQLAHARIVRLDPSRALEHPGVVGVLTGAEVAAMSRPFPVGVENAPPYFAAAGEVARYAGEPLAVVVARDRYVAEDALELIDVEYEPLEPVLDAERGEVVHDRSFSYGDPEAAFAVADLVVSERFPFPRWTSCPLECYGVIADWNEASGVLTAWANFQGPFTLHSVAASALGLPGSKLRLITPPNSGGSFGIKATVYVYVVLIGLASRKLGVPVRWTEDRLEHLAGSSASTARITGVEAGFTSDGQLLAIRYDVIEDVGAYIRAADFPYRTPSGGLYDAGDYEGCLDDALELVRYGERREEQRAGRMDGRLLGIGLACAVEPSISNMGYITLAQTVEERAAGLPKSGNAEGATVSISPLGGITVRVGTTPQGQGHETVCAQVVADALAVRPEEVEVLTAIDTSTSAWTVSSGNYSSRFSGVGAGAVYLAAQKLAAKIDTIREHLGGEPLSLRRVAGVAHWNPEALPPGVEPGLQEIALYAAPNLAAPDEQDRVAPSATHGFIADVAVVEIDRATGRVQVLDYATVHDAGRLLNPLIVAGQGRGDFAHGVGAALYERIVYDE